MRTTIILTHSLIKQIDALAREKRVSRNRVIVAAMQDYVRREQTRRLRDQLDQVYAEPLTPDDEECMRQMKRYRQHVFKEQW
jgi:metal-responsive CopG/Arc/MetJ family transcriptional regulator